jgi:hypothetical protein
LHHFPPFFLDTDSPPTAIFEPLIRFNKRFHGRRLEFLVPLVSVKKRQVGQAKRFLMSVEQVYGPDAGITKV